MSAAANSEAWELIHDEPGKSVRRHPVPGGWLYQTESELATSADVTMTARGWGNPVFVPVAWRTP